MAQPIRRPTGTQDLFPDETFLWNYIEAVAAESARLYGFQEIRVPVFEQTEVFTGAVGESSDIVQKEMYYVKADKGDETFALRPEFTAGIVRALIESGVLASAPLPIKLYAMGSAFRHEKPQKGRYREFHQFSVEYFGASDPASDAELIALARDILAKLGINGVVLKLNSIGCPTCRATYLEELRSYFRTHFDDLDEDSKLRLEKNPMRILDSKVEKTIALNANAPKAIDHLCESCRIHHEGVIHHLALLDIHYELDPKLVRGLDYYTNTVFEFVSNNLGSQGTVCGGGRYNLLIENRGGPKTPSLGFGMGMERILMELLAQKEPLLPEKETCDIFLASMGDDARAKAFSLTINLRDEGFSAEYDSMGRSLKAQMKYADKIKAKYVLVIGDSELETGIAKLKNMSTGEEAEVPLNEALIDHLYNTQISSALAELEISTTQWDEDSSESDLLQNFLKS